MMLLVFIRTVKIIWVLWLQIATCDQPPPVPPNMSPPVKDVMLRCLELNRTERPSAKELLLHPLFTQYQAPRWLSDLCHNNNDDKEYNNNVSHHHISLKLPYKTLFFLYICIHMCSCSPGHRLRPGWSIQQIFDHICISAAYICTANFFIRLCQLYFYITVSLQIVRVTIFPLHS